jgi:hypothetical protein
MFLIRMIPCGTFLVTNNDILLKEVSMKNKQQVIALESFG